jgi:argininosuccinate synthase
MRDNGKLCRRQEKGGSPYSKSEYIELEYKAGDIVGVNGKKLSPAKVLAELNRLGEIAPCAQRRDQRRDIAKSSM